MKQVAIENSTFKKELVSGFRFFKQASKVHTLKVLMHFRLK